MMEEPEDRNMAIEDLKPVDAGLAGAVVVVWVVGVGGLGVEPALENVQDRLR